MRSRKGGSFLLFYYFLLFFSLPSPPVERQRGGGGAEFKWCWKKMLGEWENGRQRKWETRADRDIISGKMEQKKPKSDVGRWGEGRAETSEGGRETSAFQIRGLFWGLTPNYRSLSCVSLTGNISLRYTTVWLSRGGEKKKNTSAVSDTSWKTSPSCCGDCSPTESLCLPSSPKKDPHNRTNEAWVRFAITPGRLRASWARGNKLWHFQSCCGKLRLAALNPTTPWSVLYPDTSGQ